MGTAQTWKRLIWKEFREGWPIVLMLLVLPVIVFLPEMFRVHWRWMSVISMLTTLVVPFVVVLWGGQKASSIDSREDFVKTHLPTLRLYTVLTSFVLPVMVLGLVGWWFGRLVAVIATDRPHYAVVWAGYLPATYMLGYFLSLTTSIWFTAITGVLWSTLGFSLATSKAVGSEIGILSLEVCAGVVAGLLFYSLSTNRISQLLGKAASLLTGLLVFVSLGANFSEFNLIPWVGVALGTLVFFLIVQRDSSRVGQTASLILVVLIAASFFVGPWLDNQRRVSGRIYYTPDWVGRSGGQRGIVVKAKGEYSAELMFFDDVYGPRDRDNPEYIIKLEQSVRILGVTDRRYVYLAQQEPGEPWLRVRIWDPLSRKKPIRTIASIPAGPGTLEWKNLYHRSTNDQTWDWSDAVNDAKHAYLSPDERYALLLTLSRVGEGVDVWLIDLKRKQGRIVLANANPATEQVVWLKDKAILAGSGTNLNVDLRKMTAQAVDLTTVKGR